MDLTETSHITLSNSEWFKGLPREALARLRSFMDVQHAAAGTTLFAEGDVGDRVFIIRRGEVRILKNQDGGTVELACRGPGEILGEMALIDESPRFASAVCRTDCEFFVLSREKFYDVLMAHPDIAKRTLRVLTARIREADTTRLEDLESKNLALESARAKLESALLYRDRILAVSPYPIIVTDGEERPRLSNPAARKLFGPCPDGCLWDWVRIRVDAVREEAERAAAAGETWRGEFEVDGPDGKVLLCKVVSVPIDDTGDGSAGRLWVFEDLTEWRALERQTIERERLALKGEMASEIAHELKNFLMVLSGHTDVLSARLGEARTAQVERSLAAICHSVQQITVFTENLLQSRHPLGQKTAIDLNEFLRSQITFLRPQKRFRSISIQTDWGEPLPPLVCDPSGLQQAFYNLMLNAVDALAESQVVSPTVTITTRYDRANSSVRMLVSDNGQGIPDGIVDRLFRERVSSKPTGHGFGLLTVHRIITDLGGTIAVANRSGGGAEFTITFPIDDGGR